MNLKVGETREIAFQLSSKDTFVINSANYSIVDSSSQEISSGVAQIDGKKVLALFNATDTGRFGMIFTVVVGDETYKMQSTILVDKR